MGARRSPSHGCPRHRTVWAKHRRSSGGFTPWGLLHTGRRRATAPTAEVGVGVMLVGGDHEIQKYFGDGVGRQLHGDRVHARVDGRGALWHLQVEKGRLRQRHQRAMRLRRAILHQQRACLRATAAGRQTSEPSRRCFKRKLGACTPKPMRTRGGVRVDGRLCTETNAYTRGRTGRNAVEKPPSQAQHAQHLGGFSTGLTEYAHKRGRGCRALTDSSRNELH